jgi:CheY-like chemotaxis protein
VSAHVILVADDDPSDVHFLRLALEEVSPGLIVRDVGDGEEAIAYLSGGGRYGRRDLYPLPDHVILDAKMPRCSGLEVLTWLRERDDLRRLPVTVLSGSLLSGDIERANALGAEYLVKPVEYAELCRLVRRFLEKNRLHA